jgi:diguanylate cyclase (GGDEF)-like protein
MEIRRYVRVILRGWWLVLPAILISVSCALVFTYAQAPIYRTTATFVVSPSASFSTLNEVLRGLDSLSQRAGIMSTFVEIATSKTVLGTVYREMELTEDQLKYLGVNGELVPSTNIIEITVESDDPLIAKMCADLIGEKTLEHVKGLYEIYDMKPLDPAYVPQSPSKPDKMRNFLLAAVLGSVVGVGSAFLLDNLRLPQEAITGIMIIDGETGLYNRTYFLQRLGEELSRARRQHYPLSLALVNIEHLDVIPDMRLPRLRNEVLRRVGVFLKRRLRAEDLAARLEGDTFALLLPDTSGPDAEQILEKLQTRMEWSVFELEESGVKLNLTFTSGVAAYNFNGTGREEFLALAQKTLQRARGDGYGKVCLFDDGEGIGEQRNESTVDA